MTYATPSELARKNKKPLRDFGMTFRLYRLWGPLAINDIYARYQRSVLGPIWLVLGNAIALTFISIIWTLIFGLDWRESILYIIAGYIAWQYISGFLTQSAELFSGDALPYLKSTPMQPTFFAARFAARLLFTYAHNVIIIFIACAVVSYMPSFSAILLWLIGILVVTVNGFFFSVTMGFLGARFRDIGYVITAFITPAFMLTPVFWKMEMLGEHQWIALVNPITHLLVLMRGTFIGEEVSMITIVYIGVFTVVNIATCVFMYARYRRYLTFWI